MVDNTTITPGTGVTVAGDDVGGVLHQRVKLSLGADGAATDALGGAGAAAAGVQRVILATDDPSVTAIGTTNTEIGIVTETAPATDTASSGLNGRLQRVAQRITSLIAVLPASLGVTTANSSLAVTLATDDLAVAAIGTTNTELGIVTETAPATDTASSGLNGRLQRIAQRITSMIALLPASLGTKTAATSLGVTLASDDPVVAVLGTTSGAAVITDATGTAQQYLRGLVKQWIAGTLVLGAGTNLVGKVKTKFIVASGTALTRPANQTPYAANDAISDNATAGSVTAKTITVADLANEPVTIERLRLSSTDTAVAGKSVRAYVYSSDPTASSGVTGGDNVAFSNKLAGFVGTMSGTFRTFSDGSVAVLVPDEGSRILTLPGSAAQTVWWQLQALEAFTPSASSTTFTPTIEGFQGGAN